MTLPTPDPDASDALLIRRLRADDRAAFDALFRQYARRVHGFALGYVKAPEDAEELVQDVFLHVWEHRHTLREDGSLRGYLFTATYHAVLNFFRRRTREQGYLQYLRQHFEEARPELDLALDGQELERLTDAALAQLPPKRREVFLLSRREGLTYAQIAQRQGISPRTVEVQIAEALRFLRKYLHRYADLTLLWLAFCYAG
jgi:RNA polymerase sigma-70 factor (family 1)